MNWSLPVALLRLGAFGVLWCLRCLRVGRLDYRGGTPGPPTFVMRILPRRWLLRVLWRTLRLANPAQERSPVSMILELPGFSSERGVLPTAACGSASRIHFDSLFAAASALGNSPRAK